MTDLNKEREVNLRFEQDDGEYTNSKSLLGWELWQIKAKAQAVPEGYVLMPLEPTQEMLGAANLAPMPMVHIDSISGREKLRISTQYKAMVNVCKSGAEG